jgi:hypothetical protein
MTNSISTIERIDETNLAAQSFRKLVRSNVLIVEDKVVLEHIIDDLSHGTNAIFDIINNIPKPCQKELLLGYKRVLQCSLDTVNVKIASLVYR